MLYPKNQKSFDKELFKNPSAEYRCTPFWAWNCELDRDELFYEIDRMKEMGMGGFHMHCRAGMSTKYLSDEFMELIKACNEKAKQEDMLAWLYDEDKWPSGFAGGYVTKKRENRQKYLYFTPNYIDLSEDDEDEYIGDGDSTANVAQRKQRAKKDTANHGNASAKVSGGSGNALLAAYDVTLNADGTLASYRRLADGEQGENVWYAYLETAKGSSWYNFESYVDTLSKSAIEDFVNITHDRYREILGDDFGKSVPAIFTDEPQVTHKKCLEFAAQRSDVVLPFTTDFPESYLATYGEDIMDKLPEVVWELPEGVSQSRYRYHDHVTERFISAFCDTIGDWCRKNGIYATGHMMQEPTLNSQTNAIGEAMRAYRSLTLPGVDMLCDAREFTTVKQAASATHQYGYPGVMSELYGVTSWKFDFRGHKLQGDWQAALGVSVRVPHLYWVSMRGEAKRDYPASIGHQSAWYPEYSHIEDHFARVNTLMTRGKADIRIGLIHPIESYWLHCGPNDSTSGIRSEMDNRFDQITKWLLHNTLDFDYVCESLLKDQFIPTDSGFKVGEMCYDVVIVPYCETLRSTTVAALEAFAAKGGKIIFMGEAPSLVDAAPSAAPAALADRCVHIGWNKTDLLVALEPYRNLKIQRPDGSTPENLISGMRVEGNDKHLFICHAYDCLRGEVAKAEKYIISVNGEYVPTLMDTESGEISRLSAKYEGGKTLIDWTCYSQSSILLTLTPGRSDVAPHTDSGRGQAEFIKGECQVILQEPNVYVIDMAKWKLDDGEWRPTDETLRICNMAKAELGLSTATCHGAQPWVFNAPDPVNAITIEATVYSDIDVENCELALENLEEATVWVNGRQISTESTGWYVDFAIKKIPVGTIHAGENTVRVSWPFGVVSNVENMFLLGNFGVRVEGDRATLIAPVTSVRFGDLTKQGFPFYGGAITYRTEIEGGCNTDLALGLFSAPAVTVSVDGEKIANVSLAPHTAHLGQLSEGKHTLDMTVYLSRINTFGTFHNSNRHVSWHGPSAWYPPADDYSYEYSLTENGLLTAPRLFKK